MKKIVASILVLIIIVLAGVLILQNWPKTNPAPLPNKNISLNCPPSPNDFDIFFNSRYSPFSGYEANNFPNSIDKGINDYPSGMAAVADFYHLLSIPFNDGKNILRVYISRAGHSNSDDVTFLRLVKSSSSGSQLVGDISPQAGSNWGGVYIPIGISKDDSHIVFKALMGSPGAGGGSATLGYASLNLAVIKLNQCNQLKPQQIAASYDAFFYGNFSKVLYYAEESNVPKSEKPGPDYKSAIKFTNLITGETRTLFAEPNTVYDSLSTNESKGITNFKSCTWREYAFECSATDSTVQNRILNLP